MKITGAALKIGSKILSGCFIHACLWADAFAEGLLPQSKMENMTQEDWETVWFDLEVQEGFVLDDGRFLNREQAAIIALLNGQADDTYRPQELHFPDLYIA